MNIDTLNAELKRLYTEAQTEGAETAYEHHFDHDLSELVKHVAEQRFMMVVAQMVENPIMASAALIDLGILVGRIYDKHKQGSLDNLRDLEW